MKRITLNKQNAEHVYEWLRMYWRGDPQRFGHCDECAQIGRRLERVIGPAAVRRAARLVKKYPTDAARTASRRRRTDLPCHPGLIAPPLGSRSVSPTGQ